MKKRERILVFAVMFNFVSVVPDVLDFGCSESLVSVQGEQQVDECTDHVN